MKRNMKQWVAQTIANPVKKGVPVLSFPAVQLMDITVRDLISSSDLQAKGMKMVADKVPSGASVSLMDLSVEAECFGSTIRVTDDEVPTVIGAVVSDEDAADALVVPEVGVCRTGLYIEAIAKASEMITDRPVLAGVIEPASATPGILEDTGLIGANAVVIEGCRIGRDAVVAAGAVVVEDVPAGAVVAGCPARIIKMKDEKTASKTALVDALRTL